MERKIKLKEQKGVTLVALGITIVVLMIIAGITISMLTGDHGIIDESESAHIQTEVSKLQEVTELYVRSKNINRVKGRDYSDVTMQEDISDVVIEVKTTEGLNLGIYQDFNRLDFKSKFGDGGKSISSDWNDSITNLNDVFAIDMDLGDIYYINNGKIWKTDGNTTVANIQEDHKNSIGDDKQKPVINSVSAQSGWANTNKTITITATDEGKSGIAGYSISLDASQQGEWVSTRATTWTSKERYPEGKYYAWARDGAGNISDCKEVNVDKIDMEEPQILSVEAEGLNITGKATDNISGISEYQFSPHGNLEADSEDWKKTSPTEGEITLNETVSSSGKYYFYVKDQAGNIAKREITVSELDSRKPQVTFEPNGSPENEWKQEYNVTVNVEDENLDESSLKYQWIEGSNAPSKESFEKTFRKGEAIPSGKLTSGDNWHLWVYAKDDSNNETIEGSEAFRIDNTPPNDEAPKVDTTKTSLIVTLKQTDEHSKINEATKQFCIKKKSEKRWDAWRTEAGATCEFTGLSTGEVYEVKTKAQDNAGSEFVESGITEVEVGAVPKATFKATPENGVWTKSSVNIEITYPDVAAQKLVSEDGSSYTPYTQPLTITENKKVYAKVVLESQEESIAEYEVKNIDTVKPELTAKASRLEISISATDTGGSGVSKYLISKSIDSDSITENTIGWKSTRDDGQPEETFEKTIAMEEEGIWWIHVMDSVGNIASKYVQTVLGPQPFTDAVNPNNYGDWVDYPVDLNDDSNTKNDWKIYYNTDDYVFLIAADLLKNTKVPDAAGMTKSADKIAYWATVSKTGSQDIPDKVADKYMLSWKKTYTTSTNANIKAVASLLDTNIWKDFAKGITGAEAIGSPTLEMFMASWNAKKYDTTLYCDESTKEGYLIGTSQRADKANIDLSSSNGKDDELYKIGNETGCWLAAPAAGEATKLYFVSYDNIQADAHSQPLAGVRPVVAIPKNISGEQKEDGSWSLTMPAQSVVDATTSDNYGDYVSYDVDLNDDKDLSNDWRIFYKNDEYVYIISKDYLQNTKLPSTTTVKKTGTFGAYWPDASALTRPGTAAINAETAKKFMLKWKETNSSSLANAKAVAELIKTDVWSSTDGGFASKKLTGTEAIGSPTLDMFIESWNAKGYTKLISENPTATGYNIGVPGFPDTKTVEVSTDRGYNDDLYFPNKTTKDGAVGYWLTSPSSASETSIMNVESTGKINSATHDNTTMALRPLVALPKEIYGQKNSENLWQLGPTEDETLTPTIKVSTTAWTRKLIVTIGYPYLDGIKKEYSYNRVDWYPYEGPLELTSNTTVYAKATIGEKIKTASLEITNIDTHEPSTTTVVASDLSTSTGKITITGTATDADNNIEGWQISKDASLNVNSPGWNPVSPTGSINQSEDIIDNSGTTYYFYVKDKVGVSKKDVAITSAMFEPMKPTIQSGNTEWTNQDVTITVGNNTVPGVSYQYTTDGGSSWNTLSSSTFTINTDGDYTDKIKAKAILKNENKEAITTAKYDNTPPTVSLSGSNATLTGKHSDALSGVVGYIFSTNSNLSNSSGFTTCSAVTGETDRTSTQTSGTWYFYAVDDAGNIGKSSSKTRGTHTYSHGYTTTGSRWMLSTYKQLCK